MQSLRRKRSNAIFTTSRMPPNTALLLVDIQYDFLNLPGSTLGVDDGTAILPIVYDLMDSGKWHWDVVAASQDWHPKDHISFASNHENTEPFTEKHVKGKNWDIIVQKMWPDHCIQGSHGAEIEEGVLNALRPWQEAEKAFIVQKGTDPQVDAYSSFASPDSPTPDPKKGESSPLAEYLQSKDIKRVVCVGIATDFCVRATALAALDWGFETILVPEAMRSVAGKEAEEEVFAEVEHMGGKVVPLEKLKEVLGL